MSAEQPTPTPSDHPTPEQASTSARLARLERIATLDAGLRGSIISTLRAWQTGQIDGQDAMTEVQDAMRRYDQRVGELS